MGWEVGIAVAGLVVSAASAGYSIYSSEQQAKEAEDIADRNAQLQAMESEEMAQRAEEEAAREESLTRAAAAASGVTGESTDIYLNSMMKTNKREIDWIRRSGTSQADITRREGSATAGALRAGGISAGISALGQGISQAGDWYSSYKKPATKANANDWMVA